MVETVTFAQPFEFRRSHSSLFALQQCSHVIIVVMVALVTFIISALTSLKYRLLHVLSVSSVKILLSEIVAVRDTVSVPFGYGVVRTRLPSMVQRRYFACSLVQ